MIFFCGISVFYINTNKINTLVLCRPTKEAKAGGKTGSGEIR
jgi:hypothetical protein